MIIQGGELHKQVFATSLCRRFLPNKSDIANQIAEWLVQVRKVISPIASEIDRMVRDLSDGRDDSFNRLLQRDDLDKSNPMNGRR